MESPARLPDDVETLRAMIVAAQAQNAAAEAQIEAFRREHGLLQIEQGRLVAEVTRLEAQNERYEHIIAQLRRLQFGKRSEQLHKDQLQLAFEDLLQGLSEIEQEEEKGDPELKAHRRTERRQRRPSLPDHLLEVEVVIEPEVGACPCCGGGLHKIGEDVSKRLDVVPAQYQVIVTRRPKYACRACEGTVVQAPARARLIDGYGAYKSLVAKRNDVVLANCWSHARRKFFDLAKGGAAPIADEILARIAQLYAIEADVRGQDVQIRRQARQERSRPVLEALRSTMDEKLRRLPGSSPTAEAIRYVQSRWTELSRFLDDGRIELDTNPVERAIRPIALNRKNALFAGSDEGAEHWAILATLVECCKLHGVNPAAYLEDVLTRLVNGHLNSRLDELTPWSWKPLQAHA